MSEESSIATIEPRRIEAPVITTEMKMEQVLAVYDRWLAFKERVKELDKLAESAVTEWIAENGPIQSGTMFYYIGHDKRTKCTDVAGAVDALMATSRGDVAAFCRDFLSANAVKYGAAKRVLDPEVYEQFFVTETIDKLESGESLPKKLRKADQAFVK